MMLSSYVVGMINLQFFTPVQRHAYGTITGTSCFMARSDAKDNSWYDILVGRLILDHKSLRSELPLGGTISVTSFESNLPLARGKRMVLEIGAPIVAPNDAQPPPIEFNDVQHNADHNNDDDDDNDDDGDDDLRDAMN
jgi:hypothetical protein